MLSLRFVTSAAMPSKHMFEKIRQSHFEKKDEGARRIQALLSHFAIEVETSLVYFVFAYARMGKAGLAMDDWQGLICLLSSLYDITQKSVLKVQLKSH